MIPIGGTFDEVKCEDLVKITIGDDPEKFFQVGSQLPQQEREELVEFLKRNIDVFAWNTYEAVGDRAPARFYMMLGQTHMNGWSRVVASQNGGSTSYIFPFRLRILQ